MNIALMRVSTDQQEVDSQRIAIENYCQSNDIPIDKWIESKQSGFKTKLEDRDDLQEVKQLALSGKLSNLIVFNLDRIGRRLEIVSLLSLLNECSVTIHSVTEGIINNNNDTDDLISTIKLWINQQESKKTSNRVKNGIKAKFKNNPKAIIGNVPFGYKRNENNELEIDEQLKPIIIKMFNEFIIGGNNQAIQYLNSVGITKYKRIQQIIKNPIYKGVRAIQGEEVYIEELKIIDEEVWNTAINSMKSRTNDKVKITDRTNYLYEGLMYHECNTKLHIDYNYANGRKKYSYYKCSKCKSDKNPIKKAYSIVKFDKIITNAIENKFKEIIIKDKLSNELENKKGERLNELENEVKLLEHQLKDKHKILEGMNKTLDKIFLGELNFPLQQMLDRINITTSEINELEKKIKINIVKLEQMKSKEDNQIKLLNRFNSLYDIYNKTNDIKKKKAIIRELIERIELDRNDNIKIVIKGIN